MDRSGGGGENAWSFDREPRPQTPPSVRLPPPGALAEWLRSGLQSHVRRFDSGRRLVGPPTVSSRHPVRPIRGSGRESAESTTVREAAEAWIDGAKRGEIRQTRSGRRFKPSTLRGYEQALERVLPMIGPLSLSAVTTSDLQALVDRWQREGIPPGDYSQSDQAAPVDLQACEVAGWALGEPHSRS